MPRRRLDNSQLEVMQADCPVWHPCRDLNEFGPCWRIQRCPTAEVPHRPLPARCFGRAVQHAWLQVCQLVVLAP